jgi:hypothetical protein
MATQVFSILVESTTQRLGRVGPLIPGSWSRHDDELGRTMPGEFLLDTGAYGAMIDLDVASSLLLADRGTREVHGIHGYGSLRQYLARLILPAKDDDGKDCLFEQVMECVGVPGLTAKSRENGAQVIGILGRVFLQTARLDVDGSRGRIGLLIQRTSGS